MEVMIERQPMGAIKPRIMNVADVLDLTVSEAAAIFANDRELIENDPYWKNGIWTEYSVKEWIQAF
nr:hypothetical protein [Nostoc sp. CHAB 5715]